MEIERWDGMPPGECEPGKVWFHVTVIGKDSHGERPFGFMFQAPANTPAPELRAKALAEIARRGE